MTLIRTTCVCLLVLVAVRADFNQDTDWNQAQSFYDFHARDLSGNDVSLEKYRGHVVIAYNGATRCPVSAKNFKLLQELQNKYPDDLRVVTFIVDGLAKESGTNDEIREYVESINPTFDVYAKIMSDGDDAHPVYKWLKAQLNEDKIKVAAKVLIDKSGKVIGVYPPTGPYTEMEETMKKYF